MRAYIYGRVCESCRSFNVMHVSCRQAGRPNSDPTKDSQLPVRDLQLPSRVGLDYPICMGLCFPFLNAFIACMCNPEDLCPCVQPPFCTAPAPLPSLSEPTRYILRPCRNLRNSPGIFIKRRKDASVLQAEFCMGRLCLCHSQSFPNFFQVRNCAINE